MPMSSRFVLFGQSIASPARVVALLWLLCVCALAFADEETVYRSVERDGTVTYSAWPPTDTRKVEPIRVNTLSPEQRRAVESMREEQRQESAVVRARLAERERELAAADEAIRQAIANLNAAETALKEGRTPRPDERLGVVGDRSRLTEAYFERLSSLEQAIEDARVQLQQAYAVRNALR